MFGVHCSLIIMVMLLNFDFRKSIKTTSSNRKNIKTTSSNITIGQKGMQSPRTHRIPVDLGHLAHRVKRAPARYQGGGGCITQWDINSKYGNESRKEGIKGGFSLLGLLGLLGLEG